MSETLTEHKQVSDPLPEEDASQEETARRWKLVERIVQLSGEDLDFADWFLRWLIGGRKDPVLLSLATAPWDDEPISEEMIQKLRQAKESARAGRVVPFEEVWKEFLEGEPK